MIQFEVLPDDCVEQYYDMCRKSLEEVKKMASQKDWDLYSNKNGFQIHTKPDLVTGLCYTRGEGFLPYSVDQIFEMIEAVEIRQEYDDMCHSGHLITKLRDDLLVFYQRFKSKVMLVQDRDFVCISYKVQEGKMTYGMAKSIEYEKKPPVKGVTRAELVFGCWILEEREGGTQCIYLTYSDPRSNFPAKVTNFVAVAQGQVVEKLKMYMDKKYKKK